MPLRIFQTSQTQAPHVLTAAALERILNIYELKDINGITTVVRLLEDVDLGDRDREMQTIKRYLLLIYELGVMA